MTDPRTEDHLVGLELQLVELVERRERATVQGDTSGAARIQRDIDALQAELASAAEAVVDDDEVPHPAT